MKLELSRLARIATAAALMFAVSGCGDRVQSQRTARINSVEESVNAPEAAISAVPVVVVETVDEVPVEDSSSPLPPEEDPSFDSDPEKQLVPDDFVIRGAGHCATGLKEDEKGHERRCCSPETGESYFAEKSAGDIRSCEGSWIPSKDECVYGESGKLKGVIWSCDRPAPAQVPVVVIKTLPAPKKSKLARVADWLGRLSDVHFIEYQKKYAGKRYGMIQACNYFLITALCEAGFKCDDPLIKPGHRLLGASHFDTYLAKQGWRKIRLPELKKMFRENRDFDGVLQRNPLPGKMHGHVAIPLGLSKRGVLVVAEGRLGREYNEVLPKSDQWVSKMNIFVTEYDQPVVTIRTLSP